MFELETAQIYDLNAEQWNAIKNLGVATAAMESNFQPLTVSQAIALMRAGGRISLQHGEQAFDVVPVDLVDDVDVSQDGDGSSLVLTGTRARRIGIDLDDAVVEIALDGTRSATLLRAFADPLIAPFLPTKQASRPGGRLACAAIELCKLAGLLPAALIVESRASASASVLVADIESYRRGQAVSLQPLGEAHVPLEITDDARIIPFRPTDGRMEHLAILIGRPEQVEAPLCRIHSECFTGDLMGSLRCDCGQQLKGAIATMAKVGAGVLLYLAQEGRGIGLANKLRAYQLQDRGLDTVEANQHLGFEPDERDFLSAAIMLKKLGLKRVRLMSNNPIKIDGLESNGVNVVERVAHEFAANDYNRDYLETKKIKSGHLLKLDKIEQPTGTGD